MEIHLHFEIIFYAMTEIFQIFFIVKLITLMQPFLFLLPFTFICQMMEKKKEEKNL